MRRVLNGAFVVSGRIGEGVVIARLQEGGWSGPSAIATGGAGFGFQVGGQVTEFVIILNTEAAVEAFARGGNVEFGGALSVAAGPVGRAAEAGILPVGAVYTYSRSQGLFAGASLEGTILVCTIREERELLWRTADSRADPKRRSGSTVECEAC